MKVTTHLKSDFFLWENARVVIGCAFVGLVTIASLDSVLKSAWFSISPVMIGRVYDDFNISGASDSLGLLENKQWAELIFSLFSFLRETLGVFVGGYFGYLQSRALKKERNDTAKK